MKRMAAFASPAVSLSLIRAVAAFACAMAAGPAAAQDSFVLSSPAFTDGGLLPSDLKCARDGSDGLTPPLEWSPAPDGTKTQAVIMHHYPRGTVEGVEAPSQYWLLWNIPADVSAIARGSPASIGEEGSDKDGRHTGYTPPCSPGGDRHEYTTTVYALNAPLPELPAHDHIRVDRSTMTAAMEGKVIAASSLSFPN